MNINKLITMLITEKGYKNKKKEISRNKKIKHNNLKNERKNYYEITKKPYLDNYQILKCKFSAIIKFLLSNKYF